MVTWRGWSDGSGTNDIAESKACPHKAVVGFKPDGDRTLSDLDTWCCTTTEPRTSSFAVHQPDVVIETEVLILNVKVSIKCQGDNLQTILHINSRISQRH